MKKQYTYYEISNFIYMIELYHDGKLVEQHKVWLSDTAKEESRLEAQGYTYGYTKEEVEEARQRYEEIFKNRIEV